MKEKENNQIEVRLPPALPPTWCSGLCRNAMNEICVEHCAIKRDCSAFEPKPNLKLSDMPHFPDTKNMTKEEKFTSVTIYLSKVVDHLQGHEDETTIYPPIRRPDFQTNESDQLSKNNKIEELLPNLLEIINGEPGKEKE